MTTSALSSQLQPAAAQRATGRGLIIRRFLRNNPLALLGIVIFLAWILISIFAPAIAPYAPLQQDIVNRLQGPNGTHWFGTDQLGRDVFSRVLYGGRLSLPAGVSVVIVAGIIGTIIGAFIIGALSAGMVMVGVSSFWQQVIKGSVIVLAVIVDQIQAQMQKRVALQQQQRMELAAQE